MRAEFVTAPKRRASKLIAAIAAGRETVLITQRGRPVAYLVDVATYEETQRRLAVLEGIARGEEALEEHRVASHSQAKKRMAQWLR